MAVMLRSLRIPSRIVNGFRGGEFNDVTGSYIIRARGTRTPGWKPTSPAMAQSTSIQPPRLPFLLSMAGDGLCCTWMLPASSGVSGSSITTSSIRSTLRPKSR